MEISWKGGMRVKTDAVTAHNELERIREKHGTLTPENVVKESRRKTAALHDEFEWDDAVAAHEHRKERARVIMRARC